MSARIRILLPLLGVLGAAAPLAAQEPNAKVPGLDIRWGATREQVATYWRETPLSERTERGVTGLEFKPWEGMNWTALVHEQRGLIGLFAISLPTLDARGCDRVFEAYVRDLRRNMRGITPTGGRNVPDGESACTAVAAGRGTAAFTFLDPATDVTAAVWVNPRTGRVHYAVGTATFRDWAGLVPSTPQPAPQAAAPAPAAPAPQQPAAAPQSDVRNAGITERALKAIRPGMSYAQVVAIIGKEGERGPSASSTVTNSAAYSWREGWRTILVTFTDGRAIHSMGGMMEPERPIAPVTLAQFQRLREGMTFEEVSAILGSGGIYNGFAEIVPGHVTESYLWRGNPTGSTLTVSFRGGRATTIMQYGLN